MLKSRKTWAIAIVVTVAATIVIMQYLFPMVTKPPQPKPGPVIEEKKYEYYTLIDDENGEVLGYVTTVKVTTGDEYVTENNKRYVVTKVEEDRAYMRSFGPADSGKDKGQFKDKTN